MCGNVFIPNRSFIHTLSLKKAFCLTPGLYTLQSMKAHGDVAARVHIFTETSLGRCSTTLCHLHPKKSPDTYFAGGWVGRRVCQNSKEWRKIFISGSNSGYLGHSQAPCRLYVVHTCDLCSWECNQDKVYNSEGHGRLTRWRKWRSCDVGEAKEGLENELWRRWSNGRVGEWTVM